MEQRERLNWEEIDPEDTEARYELLKEELKAL